MKWIINNSKFQELGYKVNQYEGKEINLLTVAELHFIQQEIPDTVLVNIFGIESPAKDANDDDRGGYSAYATKESIK